MKPFILVIYLMINSACSFSTSDDRNQFAQDEYGLTVDWLLNGQSRPTPNLKAVRTLVPDGETYRSDSPITLPAAVPQSLILMGEFNQTQVAQPVDFLRATIRIDEKVIFVRAELVAEEILGEKRRLTFQITNLNAVFQVEKSGRGTLRIEIFSQSERISSLEVSVRTPPSEVMTENIGLDVFHDPRSRGEYVKYLKPSISGKQLNLIRVVQIRNQEDLPAQVRTPAQLSGKATQWTKYITVSQSPCSYTRPELVDDVTLGDRILFLPMDSRFISEAERTVRSTEYEGSLSTTILPGGSALFGVYLLGGRADHWMNVGPRLSEMTRTTAIASCGSVCLEQDCEHDERGTAGRRFSTSALYDTGRCRCIRRQQIQNRVEISIGQERKIPFLKLSNSGLLIPLRFGDLDPNRDGEVRLVSGLPESSEIPWIQ